MSDATKIVLGTLALTITLVLVLIANFALV